MIWKQIRQQYPDKWLLIEALEAHSNEGKRILEELTVVNPYDDSRTAIKAYQQWHRKFPGREFYVIHTDREKIEITERKWLGIRGSL